MISFASNIRNKSTTNLDYQANVIIYQKN